MQLGAGGDTGKKGKGKPSNGKGKGKGKDKGKSKNGDGGKSKDRDSNWNMGQQATQFQGSSHCAKWAQQNKAVAVAGVQEPEEGGVKSVHWSGGDSWS